MRFAMSLMVVPLIGGCASGWYGEEFDNRYASTPHWRDCDGDGLGDGLRLENGDYRRRECIDPDGSDAPDCSDVVVPAGVTPRYVPNSRDCDDTYPLSGGSGRNGAQCPADFSFFADDGEITPSDYEVVQAGGKEFLIMDTTPLPVGLATLVCEQWRQGSQIEDPGDDPTPLAIEALGTLEEPFEQGRVVDAVQARLAASGDTQWVGWVGVNATDVGAPSWGWNLALGAGENPPDLPFPFCDGAAPLPFEILFSVAWPYVDEFYDPISGLPTITNAVLEAQPELMAQFLEMRLVMVVESGVDVPCLTYATDPAICPDQVGCFANLVCERATLNPQDFDIFELDAEDACVTTGTPAE